MMLALYGGQDGGVDVFRYQLAHELRKTVAELDAMGHDEYLMWAAYFKALDAKRGERRV